MKYPNLQPTHKIERKKLGIVYYNVAMLNYIQISNHDNVSLPKKIKMQGANYTRVDVDELEVSWDDSACKLTPTKC